MRSILLLIGRILMSALFLSGAYWHLMSWNVSLDKMKPIGSASPELVLVVSTIFLILGGLSVLLGYKTRIGVVLLLIEMIPMILIFNPFWTLKGNEMHLMVLEFQARMAICGGLLFLFCSGPGAFSVEKHT